MLFCLKTLYDICEVLIFHEHRTEVILLMLLFVISLQSNLSHRNADYFVFYSGSERYRREVPLNVLYCIVVP